MWELKHDDHYPSLWYDDHEVLYGKWCLLYNVEFWQPIWDRVVERLITDQHLADAGFMANFDGRERLLYLAMELGVLQ